MEGTPKKNGILEKINRKKKFIQKQSDVLLKLKTKKKMKRAGKSSRKWLEFKFTIIQMTRKKESSGDISQ